MREVHLDSLLGEYYFAPEFTHGESRLALLRGKAKTYSTVAPTAE